MGGPELLPGSLFANRFEIDRLAGSGGMGTVYRARDRYSGEAIALKLLQKSSSGQEEAGRFTREAQLLSELRHPGIVSYVAHGQAPDGQRFLAMEWLDGHDLGHCLRRGPLPQKTCLLLIERIADALAFAHQRGVIHRDLKPTNLFLVDGSVEKVKILDFGIARRMTAAAQMTRTGMVVGTPEYMAPEQARGARTITPAADIFSLGCVLYECLTGQPPFVAEHVAAVLVRILFEEPPPISDRILDVSQKVTALLQKMLKKDPAQRFEHAGALRESLAALDEIPDAAMAATLAGSSSVRSAFAESEQSLFSVVLAAAPEEDMGFHPTLRPQELLESAERQALVDRLTGLGVSVEFLASGALIVTLPQLDSATDQAVLAARAAFLIKRHWANAIVSLATGRGSIKGRMPMGEVVEQAARVLKRGSLPADAPQANLGVFVDALSARLLEGRFAKLTQKPDGALLLGEEEEADASRPLLGKPTPCVGRERELETLESQFTACIEDCEAHALLITAPPGTGKSRLRHEFLRRIEQRSDEATVLLGRSDLLYAGTPYGILGLALRRLCGLSGSESIEVQRQALTARIGKFVAESERAHLVAFIGELCGVQFPVETSSRLEVARQDLRTMHEEIRRAFLGWLHAECRRRAILFVLDDLQWGDSLSIGLLDAALRDLRTEPLCILALSRPEIHQIFPKLWTHHRLLEISLRGLSRKACERLVQKVLGPQASSEVIARISEQSGGNALFLEETVGLASHATVLHELC